MAEGGGVYVEELLFGVVAVGDEAGFKPGGTAGQAGERGGEQAAGAGFGAGDGFAALGELLGNFLQQDIHNRARLG